MAGSGEGGAEEKAQHARSSLRVRQLGALCRAHTPHPVPDGCGGEVMQLLRPEFKELTNDSEVTGFLRAVSSNRFGSAESQLDLMFAGSMFEHSCVPNCFAGNWQGRVAQGQSRKYRAVRDIAAGEALSIDYLLIPDSCRPAAGRAELLGDWGFSCSCPRCTSLPEITRAFVCPACGEPELCPRKPGPDVDLVCQACGQSPDGAYAARCLHREAVLLRGRSGSAGEGCDVDGQCDGESALQPGSQADAGQGSELIGRYHHAVFEVLWARASLGCPDDADAITSGTYRAAIEGLIPSLVRFFGDPCHPQMLDLYHVAAEINANNLDAQMRYLELEHAITKRFFPEESALLDAEVNRELRGPLGALLPWEQYAEDAQVAQIGNSERRWISKAWTD